MSNIEILKLAIAGSSSLYTLWNIFLVVVTAILATMATGKEFTKSWTIKAVLSTAFVVFAIANLLAILSLADQRSALLSMLVEDFPQREALIDSLSPATDFQYWIFHGIQDVAVLIGIWFVPWHRLVQQQDTAT